jgi:hypothetical protein
MRNRVEDGVAALRSVSPFQVLPNLPQRLDAPDRAPQRDALSSAR